LKIDKVQTFGNGSNKSHFIDEEINSRLNLSNASYHSIQILLSSYLLSKNSKIKISKTIILYAVLYAWESLLLTLRDEHRLGVSENRVLRRTSGTRKDKILQGWSKMHNEELHNLYSLSNQIIE
jgi:hypothetical protein